MKFYVAISCLLAASVTADGGLGGLGLDAGLVYAPGHASVDYYSYPKYAFEYAVKDPHTGDNKAQWEKRDGDLVKGAYSLVEPDGSLRVVEYWADDKHGFNAVVKRLGPNLHPTGVAHAPIYKAPIPVLSGLDGHGGAPISIGPIAKYDGLAAAPLLSGHIGGAISSASLYKGAPILAQAPLLPAPIIKAAPIYSAPLSIQAPLPGPIYKSGPILPASYLPAPYLKSAPYVSAPLDYSIGKGALVAPIGDYGYGSIGKGGLIGGIGDLGYGLNGKGLGGLGYGGKGALGYIGDLGYGGKGQLGGYIGDLGYGGKGQLGGYIGDLGYGGKGQLGGYIGDLGYGGKEQLGGYIGDLGYGGLGKGELGPGLIEKGPLLSGWGAPLGYSQLGLKH